MKIILLILVLIASMLPAVIVTAASPGPQPALVIRKGYSNNHPVKLYPEKDVRLWVLKNYRVVTGKKLTFKQKVALKVWQWKGSKLFRQGKEATPRQKQLGKMSLIFGIAAFVLIPIPVINILAIPSAVAAIILGISSLKGNNNTNGVIGLVLGGTFFLLAFLAFVILIAIFGGLFN